MAQYSVHLGNIEGNVSNLSVTGRVNGTEVAAVVRTGQAGLSAKNRAVLDARGSLPYADLAVKVRQALANALVDAYENRATPVPEAAAIQVERA